ncbi:hypothetical protein Tcan_05338 [Toxocara canis]|uniref:Glucuronosyltransferase n=1 Tax=Toxocara canis TaxID=6265 RepID=A0A0B2W088_TOXCA|nr:hypothetical protein Tcan_05338 [Toxocara canis]
MDLRLLLFLFYATTTFCNGAKILALATHCLADAGHSVTVLETNDKKYARDFGHGIKTEHIYVPPDPRKTEDSKEIIWRSSRSGFYIAQVYNSVGDKALKMMIEYDPETFWRVVNGTWDLLVVDELFAVHGYGIASIHKRLNGTPYIVFSTTVMLNSDSMTNALGRCWVCRVHMFISSVAELIYKPTYFTHRLANFYQHFTEYIVQPFGMMHLRDLGINDFTWHQYFRGASAFLSDQIDNIGFPVPEGTEINNVGAMCSETNATLPNALEAFISDPKSKGLLLVCFLAI